MKEVNVEEERKAAEAAYDALSMSEQGIIASQSARNCYVKSWLACARSRAGAGEMCPKAAFTFALAYAGENVEGWPYNPKAWRQFESDAWDAWLRHRAERSSATANAHPAPVEPERTKWVRLVGTAFVDPLIRKVIRWTNEGRPVVARADLVSDPWELEPGEWEPAPEPEGKASTDAIPGVTTRHDDGDYVPKRLRHRDMASMEDRAKATATLFDAAKSGEWQMRLRMEMLTSRIEIAERAILAINKDPLDSPTRAFIDAVARFLCGAPATLDDVFGHVPGHRVNDAATAYLKSRNPKE